jgi:hypothetical protein
MLLLHCSKCVGLVLASEELFYLNHIARLPGELCLIYKHDHSLHLDLTNYATQ